MHNYVPINVCVYVCNYACMHASMCVACKPVYRHGSMYLGIYERAIHILCMQKFTFWPPWCTSYISWTPTYAYVSLPSFYK